MEKTHEMTTETVDTGCGVVRPLGSRAGAAQSAVEADKGAAEREAYARGQADARAELEAERAARAAEAVAADARVRAEQRAERAALLHEAMDLVLADEGLCAALREPLLGAVLADDSLSGWFQTRVGRERWLAVLDEMVIVRALRDDLRDEIDLMRRLDAHPEVMMRIAASGIASYLYAASDPLDAAEQAGADVRRVVEAIRLLRTVPDADMRAALERGVGPERWAAMARLDEAHQLRP